MPPHSKAIFIIARHNGHIMNLREYCTGVCINADEATIGREVIHVNKHNNNNKCRFLP